MDQSPPRAVERTNEVSLGTTRIEGALPFPSSSGFEERGLGVTVWVRLPAPGTGDRGGAQVSALGAARVAEIQLFLPLTSIPSQADGQDGGHGVIDSRQCLGQKSSGR